METMKNWKKFVEETVKRCRGEKGQGVQVDLTFRKGDEQNEEEK